MLNLVAVQVDYREAQVVVAPNQFAVFETKCRKPDRFKPCPNVRMEGVRKEGFEVYSLFGAVIESQTDAEVSNLFGSDNVDDGRCHLSLLGNLRDRPRKIFIGCGRAWGLSAQRLYCHALA